MITEEVEVFYVEVINSVTGELISDVYCGQDYTQAQKEKDKLDLIWDDGSTYTSIVSDFVAEDKV